MANSGTVFLYLGQSIPGVLHAPPDESKLCLYSAAKGMEKNALAISMVVGEWIVKE